MRSTHRPVLLLTTAAVNLVDTEIGAFKRGELPVAEVVSLCITASGTVLLCVKANVYTSRRASCVMESVLAIAVS